MTCVRRTSPGSSLQRCAPSRLAAAVGASVAHLSSSDPVCRRAWVLQALDDLVEVPDDAVVLLGTAFADSGPYANNGAQWSRDYKSWVAKNPETLEFALANKRFVVQQRPGLRGKEDTMKAMKKYLTSERLCAFVPRVLFARSRCAACGGAACLTAAALWQCVLAETCLSLRFCSQG